MKTAKHFFSLEGIDGSGKTTQIDMLIDALTKEGYSVVKLREPGGAKISERVREILLDTSFKGIMSDKTELLLYNAARAQVIAEIIQPALDAGKIVIADRFAWSTFAYQGYARGLGADLVQRLTEITCDGCFPELTVVLDIDVQRGRARTAKRGEAPDRLERPRPATSAIALRLSMQTALPMLYSPTCTSSSRRDCSVFSNRINSELYKFSCNMRTNIIDLFT